MDIRNPMVGSKLTLKAIFKAKRPKIELRENIRILDVLTKLKRLDVITELKSQNLKKLPPPIGPPQVS